MLQINKFSFGGGGPFKATLLQSGDVASAEAILAADVAKDQEKVSLYVRKNVATYVSAFGVYDYKNNSWDWYKTINPYAATNVNALQTIYSVDQNYVYHIVPSAVANTYVLVKSQASNGTFVEDAVSTSFSGITTHKTAGLTSGGDLVFSGGLSNYGWSLSFFRINPSTLTTISDRSITISSSGGFDPFLGIPYVSDPAKIWICGSGMDCSLYDTTAWTKSTDLKSLSNYVTGAITAVAWVMSLDGNGTPLFLRNVSGVWKCEKWDTTLTTNSYAKTITNNDTGTTTTMSPKTTKDENYIVLGLRSADTFTFMFFDKTTLDYVGGFKLSNSGLSAPDLGSFLAYDLKKGSFTFNGTINSVVNSYTFIWDGDIRDVGYYTSGDWVVSPIIPPTISNITPSTIGTPTNYTESSTDLVNLAATAPTYTATSGPTITKVM